MTYDFFIGMTEDFLKSCLDEYTRADAKDTKRYSFEVSYHQMERMKKFGEQWFKHMLQQFFLDTINLNFEPGSMSTIYVDRDIARQTVMIAVGIHPNEEESTMIAMRFGPNAEDFKDEFVEWSAKIEFGRFDPSKEKWIVVR